MNRLMLGKVNSNWAKSRYEDKANSVKVCK